jgi:hypothetical protein
MKCCTNIDKKQIQALRLLRKRGSIPENIVLINEMREYCCSIPASK